MFQYLLTLLMATVAWAAPIADEVITVQKNNAWQAGTGGGIAGFIVLVIDVIVWFEVIQSNRPVASKILWCLGVFLFPIVGAIVYFLFSNRQAHKPGGYEPITGSA